MKFSESVKKVLLEKIQKMASCPGPFVRNPGSDFTRTRKLDFATTIRCLITMESGSLRKALLELFHYHPDTATASAFNQQRQKILPQALEFLFQEFNKAFKQYQTYRGYRLLACDGTDLNIARNPRDQENFFQSNPGEKGFNQLHLNALYDLYVAGGIRTPSYSREEKTTSAAP